MTWRQSNNKWSGGIAAYTATNIPSAKFVGKFLASIFWDQDSILLIVYLPKSQSINAEYYTSLLVQLKHILKEKRRGKFNKVNLFLHDKSPSHRHLQSRTNWPTWASNVLISHRNLRIWPRRTNTCHVN